MGSESSATELISDHPIITDDDGSQDNDEDNADYDDDWYNNIELDSCEEELIQTSSESVFGFETDHAALKGNTDYHKLIKALALLEAQHIKAIEDIDRLEHLKTNVKHNPREYLNKLLIGDTSDIPARVKVHKVPEIDWSKYCRKITESPVAHIGNDWSTGTATKTDFSLNPNIYETNYNSDDNLDSMFVRGRTFNQTKPQTFNQLWTPEEQLRLEELLTEFPRERNENSRWRKIAQALGNRTTKQVCSRVQKYFKKLNKAGLPIPGHQLKTNSMLSLKKKPRKVRKINTRDSTFFPTNHLGAPQLLDNCEEDDRKTIIPALTSELKAEIIKRAIECKEKDAQLSRFSHANVKCAVCTESPLIGTRWRCLICSNVSLCSDCVIDQVKDDCPMHPPSHPMEPISHYTVDHWDPDYMPDSFQSTNYLDPNFVTPNVI